MKKNIFDVIWKYKMNLCPLPSYLCPFALCPSCPTPPLSSPPKNILICPKLLKNILLINNGG